MTNEEAINLLMSAYGNEVIKGGRGCGKTAFRTALLMGANAIKVLERYKGERDVAISQLNELGLSLGQNVNHVKEVIDKQEAEDVIVEKYFYGENYYCPCCRKYLGADHNDLKNVSYCDRCGQKITINSNEFLDLIRK